MRDEPVNYYYYLNLIKDQQRVKAFESAIRQVVKPGDVTVEIGSGLGTYSFFSARAGARKAYAIEKTSVIRTAEQLRRVNGLSESVELIEGDTTEVNLPERGDVLILENFSSLLIRRRLAEMIQDALDRHLKSSALVIPEKASLFMAPISDEALWQDCLRLETTGWELYGLKLDFLRDMMINNPHVRRASPASLISSPQLFKEIQIREPKEFLFDVVLRYDIEKEAVLHGFLAWFDLQIASGICLSNAPWNPDSTWGQVVFPLSTPLAVKAGETVTFRLSCSRGAQRDDLWWAWQCLAPTGVSDNSSLRGLPFHVTEFE